MKLGNLLSNSQKKSMKSVAVLPVPESIDTPIRLPNPSVSPVTGLDSATLWDVYDNEGLECAAMFFYENQDKFGVYPRRSPSQCKDIIASEFHERRTTIPVSRMRKPRIDDQSNYNHVHRRRYKGKSPTNGCYRRDQEHQAEPIWRSDKSRLKQLGIAK